MQDANRHRSLAPSLLPRNTTSTPWRCCALIYCASAKEAIHYRCDESAWIVHFFFSMKSVLQVKGLLQNVIMQASK